MLRYSNFSALLGTSKALSFSFVVVDRLQAHWEDSQTKLSDRTKQLHNMAQDSTEWLNAKKGADHVIKRASGRLESWQEITYTADGLKRQNAELKVGWGRNNLLKHAPG